MEFTLSLTHRCNLRCRYCYGGQKFDQDMSEFTAKAIVDFAFARNPTGSLLDISFFGGEPLLCFDMIQDVVAYSEEQSSATGTPVSYSIVTNGTLLTHEILQFMRSKGMKLCISLDGLRETHNANRIFPNDTGSFDSVIKGLKSALGVVRGVQVNCVYGPDTYQQLPEMVTFLSGIGTFAIHLNLNVKADWNGTDFASLSDSFAQVADLYIDSYKQGKEMAINLFDSKIMVLLKRGYRKEDMCAFGRMEWAFSPAGNAYPCERFIGEDKDSSFSLGNIHKGIQMDKLCSIQDRSMILPKECEDCQDRPYCMNWCICTNHYLSGDLAIPAHVLCEIEKALIKQARRITTELIDNDLFIDHFFQYVSSH